MAFCCAPSLKTTKIMPQLALTLNGVGAIQYANGIEEYCRQGLPG
jgi:hypothetical protein